jgi:hypothetical protein
MDDQDLSGDDLKVVRYRILFTKPDLEYTFEEKQELINYSTNGGSLGGLKVGQFVGTVEQCLVERPEIWRQNDYPPPGENRPARKDKPKDEKNWDFPAEDQRYLEFQFEVIRREPKQDANYDRDRNRDLRGIRESIRDVAKKIEGLRPPGSGGGNGFPGFE